MKLNEIVAPSMKELFVKEIESLILSGQLSPGERLPTEREMASEMKVSRTIVNLGMTELAQKGFVEILPRKGAVVADYVREGKLDTLISIVNFNGGRFDRRTLSSIMQFRRINEVEGTYLCALNRTEEEVAKLREQYAEIMKATDPLTVAKLFFKFHHLIFCASGNNIFPLVYNAFEPIFLRLISSTFKNIGRADGEEILNRIKRMIDAIEEKDADRAKRISIELLDEGIRRIDSNYGNWF